MKEITEDYCDFETAKLLREKGFDEKTSHVYYYYEEDNGWTFEKLLPGDKFDKDKMIHCPTQALTMKWLREVHGIHINVFRYPAAFSGDNNEQRKPWWFQYTLLKPIKEIDIDSHMTNDEFESAEEAMGYAIKYCLENLI